MSQIMTQLDAQEFLLGQWRGLQPAVVFTKDQLNTMHHNKIFVLARILEREAKE
jgi:hypothetical protein